MLSRAGPRLAWGACALTYLVVATALGLGAASAAAFRDPQLTGSLAQAIIPPMGLAVAGGLIASRLPRNRLGWVLLVASLVSAVSGFLLMYQIHGLLTARGSLPGVQWAAWLASLMSAVLYPGLVLVIMLLFPDGRLPSPRWRVLVALDIALVLLNMAVSVVDPTPLQSAGLPAVPNPTGLSAFKGLQAGPLGWITFLGSFPLVLAGIGSLVVRLARSHGELRQQLRWVVYAFGVATILDVLLSLSTLFLPPSPQGRVIGNVISNLLVVIGFGVAVPAAMAVAILKYRLYDIDIVISRTLFYGSLAAFISAVYVGIVVGLGTLVGSRGQPNLLLSIGATAVVAIAFQPVRERVEVLANRLVYGYRATPYQALTEFSHRVAGAYADEEVLTRLARVLVEGTGAGAASVWLQGIGQAAATWPQNASPVSVVDGHGAAVIRHEGEVLGQIVVKKRPGEPLTPVEAQLVNDLAAQAGQVLRNVLLTSELRARVHQVTEQSAELRASRQRIVAAQDAERRRLERNIHDGAQQHLVALAVKLRLTMTLAKRDRDKARGSLQALKAQTAEALATIRDLAQGIYPPALRENGLVQALRQHAVVEADGAIGRFDPEIEASVYFACLEAVQNATKYARASRVWIDLQQRNGQLIFRVSDDGAGFDPAAVAEGTGVQNMKDRVASLGGRLTLDSRPGKGTTVSGWLPLPAVGVTG